MSGAVLSMRCSQSMPFATVASKNGVNRCSRRFDLCAPPLAELSNHESYELELYLYPV